MAQMTFIADDEKLRVGNQVIAHRGDLVTRLGLDPSVVHAIQYDTNTGEGHIEYKPGAPRPEVSTDQVGTWIGRALGDKLAGEFNLVLNEVAAQARSNAAVRVRVTSVEVDQATVMVDDTSQLSAGMEIESSNQFPNGATIVSVDSATQITLSENAKAASRGGMILIAKRRSDVRLVPDDAEDRVRKAEFLDFRQHPDFGVDLSSED